MAIRSFPHTPSSARDLEPGDLIAVPMEAGEWACLIVVEVCRNGVGARTTFIAGAVAWRGTNPPTESGIAGLTVAEQALTGIELFKGGGVRVVGNIGPVSTPFDSSYRDHHVGAVTRVWGWQAALKNARKQADLSGPAR